MGTKIHSAIVPLHNTASVQVYYTIAQTHTQQVLWGCLNHRATATKDTYHVTLYKQQYTAKRFTMLNLWGETESVRALQGEGVFVMQYRWPVFTAHWDVKVSVILRPLQAPRSQKQQSNCTCRHINTY